MFLQLNKVVASKAITIPISHRKYLMDYAIPHLAEDHSGTIFLQSIKRQDYVISHGIFSLKKQAWIRATITKPSIMLIYWISGHTMFGKIPGVGEIVLTKGHYNLFYLPRGVRSGRMKKGDYTALYVEMSGTYLNKLSVNNPMVRRLVEHVELSSKKGSLLPVAKIPHEFEIICNDLLRSYKTGSALDLELEAGLLRLLSLYLLELENPFIITSASNKKSIINHALKYINDNTTKVKLPVKDLAKQLNICLRTLERLFKREVGKTMVEYHQHEKMKKALFFVIKSNMPIKSISIETGYQDVSAFIRIFKKYYHMTPTMARGHPEMLPSPYE
ncbi:helix-turn-helix transcriptional regulator [Chitinophaga varians]|uniref:helix-turn-helix transcriptional regulator n=1 Tax=Chitinophaga varians TaxID=2202339 RepID=UPI00165EC538|nr:helix-turn-helix transcriptional regulator [Chitinophaga varians]MBC9909106.1 helix-turn-helix transcriptional regulator [Chitinophaga varians]